MHSCSLSRVETLSGHEERVWCVAWRPCAEPPQLASCGSDRTVCLWGQTKSTEEKGGSWNLLTKIDVADRHSRSLRSLAWDPNGDIFALASFDATTSLWREVTDTGDPKRGSLEWECAGIVTGHESEVKSVTFSPSGEYLATCGRDKSVWIYSTEVAFEYECVAILQSHVQDVKMVKWHPSQDVLFSCSYDDTVKVWGPDGDDWSCKETLSAHTSTVWCISFDANGSRFATCSDDRTVRVWAPGSESSSPSESATGDKGLGKTQLPSFTGVGMAAAAFMSPLFHRPRLAKMGSFHGESASTGHRIASEDEPCSQGESVVSRAAPKDAACAWHSVAKIEGVHPRPIYHVAWVPFAVPSCVIDAQSVSSIATACGDNCVRVFQPQNEISLSSWVCVAAVTAHAGDVNFTAWRHLSASSSANAVLASAGDDCDVVLWSFGPTGKEPA
eukprot:TRINITY_DN13201_c0_g1_i1.p1 TRINITY_DN13201_c0_g1~~TRINITY_DN13201_c0_g1_i1.p1  ORF type:complete len:473 (-),score=58.46 TRINITY_DN13201_c0_g1_i1:234-1565(-)